MIAGALLVAGCIILALVLVLDLLDKRDAKRREARMSAWYAENQKGDNDHA